MKYLFQIVSFQNVSGLIDALCHKIRSQGPIFFANCFRPFVAHINSPVHFAEKKAIRIRRQGNK